VATILPLNGYLITQKMTPPKVIRVLNRRVVFTESDVKEPKQYEVVFIENMTITWTIEGDMSENMLDMVRYWLEHDDEMFDDAYERWE